LAPRRSHPQKLQDGIVFKADSIRTEHIREADAYAGVRVRFVALLGTGEEPLQVAHMRERSTARRILVFYLK
jgi:hypothetical protein